MKESEKRQSKSRLAKALFAEISTLMLIYDKIKLKDHAQLSKNDIKIVRLGHEYLSVYEHNTDKLGIFESEDVEKIVELYTLLKGLMDSLIVLSDKWEDYVSHENLNGKNNLSQTKLQDTYTTFNVVLDWQKEVLSRYRDVLERLAKY